MKAAVLHEVGRPMQLEEVELAEPRAGEVLVRVLAAGVCHSDLHYMVGDLKCPLPVILGHEGAGIIERVGPGVERVTHGDLVVLMWRPRCGHCTFCTTGRPALCVTAKVQVATGGLLDGTTRLSLGDGRQLHHFLGVSCFAEFCVVAEQSVVKVPPQTPPKVAALVGCAVVTGIGAVLNVMGSGAGSGSGVLVIGAGGVGLSVVMGAALVGAYPILVADTRGERLRLAVSLGATHPINVDREELEDAVRAVQPEGVQWAFEAVGKPTTLAAGVRCLRPTGTLVAIGLSPAEQTVSLPINYLVQREIKVVGSLYGSSNMTVQIPRLLELYEAGRLRLDMLIGSEYRLEEINEAFERLPSESVGRGLVLPKTL
jgi:S-(hydroxymethyl)glutathione dehydrogenase/alcohol dehydrogenase